MMQLKKHLYKK